MAVAVAVAAAGARGGEDGERGLAPWDVGEGDVREPALVPAVAPAALLDEPWWWFGGGLWVRR